MTIEEMQLAMPFVEAQTRRVLRTAGAVTTIARRRGPKWLVVAIAIALAIPGPQDELVVVALVAFYAWRHPKFRRLIVRAGTFAWNGASL